MSTRAQAERIIESEKALGQLQTLAVGPTGKGGCVPLYDGHQRCSAWMTVKPPTYKVVALQSNRALTEQERRKVAVLLNTASGSWDWEKLSGWKTAELKQWGMDKDHLKEWNNDANNLKELLNSEQPPETDAPPDLENSEALIKKWKVKQGAMYQIGEHRLLCGDSTLRADVDRVMQGELADLVFTDPPYGVSYDASKRPEGKHWQILDNDMLHDQGLVQFLSDAFTHVHAITQSKAALYCFHASINQMEFETALKTAGFVVKQQLIWNKGFGFNRSDYHWAHEPMFYCRKKDQSTIWYGDRTGQTIIGQRRSQLAALSKETLVKMITQAMDDSTVWEIDRDVNIDYVHSTQKPTRLAARAINNSSAEGQIVIDFFAGSGSTMVAAQNLGRKCRAMELDKGYTAVILERMLTAFPSMNIKRLE
jgi:DNA modification methylase